MEISTDELFEDITATKLKTYLKKTGIKYQESNFLFTALESNCGKEIFEVLFEYGCDKFLNEQYQFRNFLEYALEEKTPLSLIKYFVSKGANPKMVNSMNSSTLLHFCIRRKLGREYLNYFSSFIPIMTKDGGGNTTFDYLFQEEIYDPEIFLFFVDNLKDINHTNPHLNENLLFLACKARHPNLELIQKLVGKGIDVDHFNDLALNAFCYLFTRDLSQDVIQFFLDQNQNINCLAENSRTLLMGVCQNNADLIVFCLRNGADARLLTHQNESALHFLLKNKNSQLKHFKLLKDYGVGFNARNSKGQTALDLALQKMHGDLQILEFLIQNTCLYSSNKHNLNPLAIALRNRLPLKIIKCIIENSSNFNQKRVYGEYPIFHATSQSLPLDHQTIEYLVKEKGVKFDFRNANKLLPIEQVITNTPLQLKTVKLLIHSKMDLNNPEHKPLFFTLARNPKFSPEIWDFFLDFGVDINRKSLKSHSNLLTYTIKHKKFDIFKYLINLNMLDVNHVNKKKETPVFLASRMELIEYLELMNSQGAYYDHKVIVN
ncbi:phytochrome-interacting ankyrin-repeat protein 1-related [Anaeramoeba flamelloides]|uniref:Phytochrome-interacting ankyrin-repeat protein 1-related n=1 Tax=Anaeramoeba flamelloides TaxID=1746091 RepID=A0AAV7Y4N0_9EUKA|nr:phytochrome-interacting ankyrin-repeat protein 1-related [Anaeramoeba flamelloides]